MVSLPCMIKFAASSNRLLVRLSRHYDFQRRVVVEKQGRAVKGSRDNFAACGRLHDDRDRLKKRLRLFFSLFFPKLHTVQWIFRLDAWKHFWFVRVEE